MANPDRQRSRLLAIFARALTLSRLGLLPFFLLFLAGAAASPGAPAAQLVVAYLWIAGSDLADGPIARRGNAVSARWGAIDAAADVVVNLASLVVASALGIVRWTVPLALALLAASFLVRCLRAGELREDTAGKAAGVLFYVLVGAVVAEVCGVVGAGVVWTIGDIVTAYAVGALALGTVNETPPRHSREGGNPGLGGSPETGFPPSRE